MINQEYNIQFKPFFSVFNITRKLREQRQGMISSENQYKFIYDFCVDWIKTFFFE